MGIPTTIIRVTVKRLIVSLLAHPLSEAIRPNQSIRPARAAVEVEVEDLIHGTLGRAAVAVEILLFRKTLWTLTDLVDNRRK